MPLLDQINAMQSAELRSLAKFRTKLQPGKSTRPSQPGGSHRPAGTELGIRVAWTGSAHRFVEAATLQSERRPDHGGIVLDIHAHTIVDIEVRELRRVEGDRLDDRRAHRGR